MKRFGMEALKFVAVMLFFIGIGFVGGIENGAPILQGTVGCLGCWILSFIIGCIASGDITFEEELEDNWFEEVSSSKEA